MQRIEELVQSSTILDSIAKCTTYGEIQESETRANIKGLHVMFEQLRKTPDMIRLLLQMEFQFEGMINACGPDVDHEAILEAEWYNSTFLIPQYSCVKKWMTKCVEERDKGKTVVCIIPCRTNTDWFHEYVLAEATDLRFIKGRVTLPGFKKQNQFSDAICVFTPKGKTTTPVPLQLTGTSSDTKKTGGIAILSCNTSFTTDETDFMIVNKPEESDDHDDTNDTNNKTKEVKEKEKEKEETSQPPIKKRRSQRLKNND